MRLWGWCERCHRLRTVSAGGSQFAVMSLALNGMAVGVCDECEEETDDRRR